MKRIGIDVGGTGIAIGIVDENYRIVDKTSLPTADYKAAGDMIEAIAKAVSGLMAGVGIKEDNIEAVGVCVPGTAELDTGMMLYANNLMFENVPFLDELKKVLGSSLGARTYFENDANAAAIGEYITGCYDVPNFVMVTLGTGVGGGIIINGKLLRGCNYAAAEFGHMTINVEGVDCNCGRRGCFEDYASATALIEMAKDEMTSIEGKGSLLWEETSGDAEALDGKKFFDAVRKGDMTAKKVLDKYSFYLSEGLINIINVLQPDVLVLSGGITRAADLFLDQVKEKVAKEVYSRSSKRNTQITLPRGIADAGDVGIVGAALIDRAL